MTNTNLPAGPKPMTAREHKKAVHDDATRESEETPLDAIYANWFGYFSLRTDKVYLKRYANGRIRGKMLHYERGDPLFLSRPGDLKEFKDIEREYNKLRKRYDKLCAELEVIDVDSYVKIWDRTRFIKWWRRATNIQALVDRTGLTANGLYQRAAKLREAGYHMPQLDRVNKRRTGA